MGKIPRLPVISLLQLPWMLFVLERQARRVTRPGAPAPTGDRVDETLASWMDRRGLRRDVRGLLTTAVRALIGHEPSDISHLELLRWVRSTGSLRQVLEVQGGAQQTRFVRGSGDLVRSLAVAAGHTIRTGCPVRAVRATPGTRVRVEHDGGVTEADAVIVAVPPELAADLVFEPRLPEHHRAWLGATRMGSTVKCLIAYDEPFWRQDGWSGEVASDRGLLSLVFDNTSAQGTPCLVAFASGSAARALGAMDPATRQEAVLGRLSDFFGDRARQAVAYRDRDWDAEPWSRGCPLALPGPHVAGRAPIDPHAPHGRIHWAGTELATEWRGYMDGAIESGRRAADEVLVRLRGG